MSTNNIGALGIGAGFDTQALLDQLTKQERVTVDKLYTQRDKIDRERGYMQYVNTLMLQLDSKYSALRLESTLLSKIVKSSNDALVSATADVSAAEGTHTVKVTNVAKAASAESGLEGALYGRRAYLTPGQTLGLGGINVVAPFAPVAATLNSLLTQVREAGAGSTKITKDDQIKIAVRLADGTLNTVYYNFEADATDTLDKFAKKIVEAFKGSVNYDIGANGELIFTEKAPKVGDVSSISFDPLDNPALGFTFIDSDYSGSTFDIGSLQNIANVVNQKQIIMGDETFQDDTTGEVATLTTDLNNLLQTFSNLDTGDSIKITGTEQNGAAVSATYTYTLGDTMQQFLDAINTAFTSSTAKLEGGKIVLVDDVGGVSQSTIALEFVDQGTKSDMYLGNFLIAQQGMAKTEKTISTSIFTDRGEGQHELVGSTGTAGKITGQTAFSLDPRDIIAYPPTNVDTFTGLTIDVDGPAGKALSFSIIGITNKSTVQDVINLINAQVPAVTAQLVNNGGNLVFEVVSNEGGRNIKITDTSAGTGILQGLMGIAASSAASNDAGVYATAADALSTNVTVVDNFIPDNAGNLLRRVYTGTSAGPINNLIGGMQLTGGFQQGAAVIKTIESSELNTNPRMLPIIFGGGKVTSRASVVGQPWMSLNQSLALANFADVAKDSLTSPFDHTDGTFSINGKVITIGDITKTSVSEVMGKVNTSGAGVVMSYDEANDRFILRASDPTVREITLGGEGDTSNFLRITNLAVARSEYVAEYQEVGYITTNTPLSNANFDLTPDSGVFTINGVKITIDSSVETLEEVIKKINNSAAGVTASYDSSSDTFSLTQKLDDNTTRNFIEVGNKLDTSNFLVAVRLLGSVGSTAQIGNKRERATVQINGKEYLRNTNSIKDVIQGVSFEIFAETEDKTVTINVNHDTDRSINAIADFITTYNSVIDTLNPANLTNTEKAQMVELTKEQSDKMSLDDLDTYITRRNGLLQRKFILQDQTVRRTVKNLMDFTTGLVINSGKYNSLSAINITSSAEIGSGYQGTIDSRGRLIVNSADKDEILTKLKDNTYLKNALKTNPYDVYTLFANELVSTSKVTGSKSLASGINPSNQVTFQITDGKNVANVILPAGNTSQSNILGIIGKALTDNGMSDSIVGYFDNKSQINFMNSQKGLATTLINIIDTSLGSSNLMNTLGVTPGLFIGNNPKQSGGIAMRAREYMKTETSVGGSIFERIRSGGSYERQLEQLTNSIITGEERVANFTKRMRQKFVNLDKTMSNLSSQRSAIESAIAKMNSSTSSS